MVSIPRLKHIQTTTGSLFTSHVISYLHTSSATHPKTPNGIAPWMPRLERTAWAAVGRGRLFLPHRFLSFPEKPVERFLPSGEQRHAERPLRLDNGDESAGRLDRRLLVGLAAVLEITDQRQSILLTPQRWQPQLLQRG